MSTATRLAPHAPSPSYVPRGISPAVGLPPKPQVTHAGGSARTHSRSHSASRLDTQPQMMARPMGSPNLGAAGLTPRLPSGLERSSSGLRNEVKGDRASDAGREAAKAILKMLSSLPAPLPESLPPTFLPTPAPSNTGSPSSSSSSTSTSPARTFRDYARSTLKRPGSIKRKTSSASDSSDEPGANHGAGIGLGLSMSAISPEAKKRKIEGVPNLARSASTASLGATGRGTTPVSGASPAMGSKRLGQSGLRNEVTEGGEREAGKERWSRERWTEAAQEYRNRALLLKRHGDAYQRVPSAHHKYTSILPHDPLKGLLCLTDSVLLWLYAYFCDEQGGGRVRSSPYNESAPLRDFVRRQWESEVRKAEDDSVRREHARAMVGLMHLIEAVVCYHLTAEQLAHLSKRGRELASASTPTHHGPSPGSTHSASPPGTVPPPTASTSSGPAQISPVEHPSSSSSSHHSPESQSSYALPADLLPLISTSTSSSSRAAQHLLTSRHHLSLRLLRSYFPRTFEFALTSELNDEALPVPGDNLGSARRVDVDHPERFAWPIELGMCAPVAHTVAFGRCLVEEAADNMSKEWTRRLE
ncbi:hypothetical protein IAU60_006723 [Kwoniella sp. DSM 27419]